MNAVKCSNYETFQKLLLQSRKSIQRVSNLVEDLLNVRRLQEGEMQLEKTSFVLSQTINACRNPVTIAGKQDIRFTGDVSLEVWADEQRVDQVITNIVTNAIKYAPNSKTITINIEKVDDFVKASFTDWGPGIPAEKAAHLFDRYYRVDPSGNHVSGLGLGLYISQEIIRRHGGEIGVASEVGKGSTFWFTLPSPAPTVIKQ